MRRPPLKQQGVWMDVVIQVCPMQIKTIAIAALILIAGCGSAPQIESPAPDTTQSPAPEQIASPQQTGWKLAAQAAQAKGRVHVIDEYSELEAVHRWIAVPVTLTNTSGARQGADDAMSQVFFAVVVGSDGIQYDIALESFATWSDVNTPYEPNESREGLLLFDMPDNVQPVQLLTNTLEPDQSLTIDL